MAEEGDLERELGRNPFNSNTSSLPPDQLRQIQEAQQAQLLQQRLEEIQRKVFQTKEGLSPEENQIVEQFAQQNPDFSVVNVVDKQNKGLELDPEEERQIKKLEHQQVLQSDQNLARFHQNLDQIVADGGKKVIHFTDPHLDYEDLETRIGEVLSFHNFDPNTDLFVNTGDLLPDLIDLRKDGLEALNPNRIAFEGRLSDNEAHDFIRAYEQFLAYSGMTIQDIESGGATLGQGGEQLFQRFQAYLYLMSEPDHLTPEELEKFRELREEVHQGIAKAIHGHAQAGYERIRGMFDKYGITPENSILVAGNHDVEAEMREILGDYMANPGEVKEVQGYRIGNMISGSTGEALGFHLSQELGWQDVRKDPRTWYNTDSFRDLREHINDAGLEHIDDFRLKTLIENAKLRQSLGIADSALAKYFTNKIRPEVDNTVNKKVASIPRVDPNTVDFFVGHGNPVHPQFAGAEERQVHDYIKESGKPYLYGHIHGNDSQKFDNVFYLNPGTAENYGHGAYAFNKNKELELMTFANANPLTRGIDYRLLTPELLSSEDKKYGSLGG